MGEYDDRTAERFRALDMPSDSAKGYGFWVLQCTIVQSDVFADRVFPSEMC